MPNMVTVSARIVLHIGLLFVVASAIACARHPQPNTVVQFLDGADRQAETDNQQTEIQRALEDMLSKTPGELRQQRYADYQGHKNSWDLVTLLEKYFVANKLRVLDRDRFYEDVSKPEAKSVVRKQLESLRQDLQRR
jgi:hypothetical protein